jgi:hypothetical protein
MTKLNAVQALADAITHKAAAGKYTAEQVTAAAALIVGGHVHHTAVPGMLLVDGGNGTRQYHTDVYGNCNCPARGACKHGCAVEMVASLIPCRPQRQLSADELFARL